MHTHTLSLSHTHARTHTLRVQGYHDGQDMAHTLIPQAAGWGAAAVTLHGRTREQRYSR